MSVRFQVAGEDYDCVFIASVDADSCYQCGESRAAHANEAKYCDGPPGDDDRDEALEWGGVQP